MKRRLFLVLLALTVLVMVGCVKDGKVDRSEFVVVDRGSVLAT